MIITEGSSYSIIQEQAVPTDVVILGIGKKNIETVREYLPNISGIFLVIILTVLDDK